MDEIELYCLERVCTLFSQVRLSGEYTAEEFIELAFPKNDIPSPLTKSLIDVIKSKISGCGNRYIDVLTGKYVKRTVKNNHPLFWKRPFCGPSIHKSLVIWAFHNITISSPESTNKN